MTDPYYGSFSLKKTICSLTYFIISLLVLTSQSTKAFSKSHDSLVVKMAPKWCSHGLHHQPKGGPFAVIAFCDDALGTHIGIICYAGVCEQSIDPNEEIRFEAWSLDNRMWQEKEWANDVTSIAWAPNQKSLFVSTNEIYGSGALYQIDLERRKFTQLLPENRIVSTTNPGVGYTITDISKDGTFLFYQQDTINNNNTIFKLQIKGP